MCNFIVVGCQQYFQDHTVVVQLVLSIAVVFPGPGPGGPGLSYATAVRPRDRVLRFQSRRPGAIRREHAPNHANYEANREANYKGRKVALMRWNSTEPGIPRRAGPAQPSINTSTCARLLALPTGRRKSFSAPVATDKLRREIRNSYFNYRKTKKLCLLRETN